MAIDAKWLDILKASGWQTAAIAAAGAVLLYANAKRLLPVPLERWMIQTAVATTIVCVCLTISSIVSATMRATQRQRARLWSGLVEQRRLRREVAAYIPSMTPREREIIAYLLAHNQRIFTNTPDGGHANTLISRGIVVPALRPGQTFTYYEMPFEVPGYIWSVLAEHRAEFPYTPPAPGETAPHPWRVHWMSR